MVIINYLIKLIYYEPIKTMINIADLAKVTNDIVIRHYDLLESIISDKAHYLS